MNGSAAKVRCRTCYSDHDYRNEQVPPTKKELAKQKELYNAVLAGVAPAGPPELIPDPAASPVAGPIVDPVAEPPAAQPASRKKKK